MANCVIGEPKPLTVSNVWLVRVFIAPPCPFATPPRVERGSHDDTPTILTGPFEVGDTGLDAMTSTV
jgi:hypothetical protein